MSSLTHSPMKYKIQIQLHWTICTKWKIPKHRTPAKMEKLVTYWLLIPASLCQDLQQGSAAGTGKVFQDGLLPWHSVFDLGFRAAWRSTRCGHAALGISLHILCCSTSNKCSECSHRSWVGQPHMASPSSLESPRCFSTAVKTPVVGCSLYAPLRIPTQRGQLLFLCPGLQHPELPSCHSCSWALDLLYSNLLPDAPSSPGSTELSSVLEAFWKFLVSH